MTVVTQLPITDAALREALEQAHLPSLLPALGLLTGDLEAQAAFVPRRYRVVDEQGGMTPEQQADARAYAFEVLRAWSDGTLPPAPPADRDAVLAGLKPLLGPDFEAYAGMSLEELAIDDADPRAPRWQAPTRPASEELDVVLVGAGMSGLLAVHRLAQAGVRAVVLDKNDDVGGTWRENRYPGCRVDVPSHLYSYSCLDDQDWKHLFATRDEVHAGFRAFAEQHGLLDHVRFEPEVLSADWDEAAALWRVAIRRPDGDEEELATRVLVSAVGQLNRPKLADLPGRDAFAGPQCHTATWPEGLEVAGKRVAVVGTGASAIQVVTGLLDAGASVEVFQRSPAWLFPTPELRRPVPEGLRWLLRHVPTYVRWYRLWLHRSVSDGLLPFAECDPAWEDPRSVSAINDTVRQALTAYIQQQFGDDEQLLGAMLPRYPPFSKRVIRDDGSWARAFLQDGARLVTTPIAQVVAEGIRTDDGELHQADVIVHATGFEASRFLVPMRLRGRDGEELHARWGADATAYLGMAVPGFPNLFLLYGPNTNIVVNGSAVFFSECQVTYLLDAVRTVLQDDAVLDCRPEIHDQFVERIDGLNAQRAWACAGVSNWYLSPTGRVSQNWPSTALEYWERTRAVDPADYSITKQEAEHVA